MFKVHLSVCELLTASSFIEPKSTNIIYCYRLYPLMIHQYICSTMSFFMKPYILSFLICCTAIFNHSQAQTVFAPAGAHWYNTGNDAYFHSYSDGDTVISGRTCTRIRRITHSGPTSWASNFSTIYTYTAADTVFIYNKIFAQFTPLYIFNVNEGDTIRIPKLSEGHPTPTASYFSYRVDSVRTLLYDTAHLRTVFTYSLNEDSVIAGAITMPTYGYMGTLHGAYAERIGGINRGIFLNCYGCAVIPEDCGCIGALRCYNDPATSIKLTTEACEPPVAVGPTATTTAAIAYPTPAGNTLHINAPANSTIQLTTLTGQVVQIEHNNNTLDVTTLPAGTYLLRIIWIGGTKYERVQVVH